MMPMKANPEVKNPRIVASFNGFKEKESNSSLIPVATLYSPKTGIKLSMNTTEPAMVVYSGNYMEGLIAMDSECKKHGAVCLEPGKPTDAIHHPEFKDLMILRPGEQYYHKTEYKFEIE